MDKGAGEGARKRFRLEELRAEWLAEGAYRYQMGVRFLCPGHPYAHHALELWFLNPADGGPPKPMPALYYRHGCMLEELTLTSGLVPVTNKRQLAEHVWVEGHWCGYVYQGWAIDALRLG